ncbi:MAG: hypothetical protein RIR67_841 [Bacteroidota bacterium]|jgi:hypothetical protein
MILEVHPIKNSDLNVVCLKSGIKNRTSSNLSGVWFYQNVFPMLNPTQGITYSSKNPAEPK